MTLTSSRLRSVAAALCSAAAIPPAEGQGALELQTSPRLHILHFFGGIVAAALLHCAL